MTRTTKGITMLIPVILLSLALGYGFGLGVMSRGTALQMAAAITMIAAAGFTYILDRPQVDWFDNPAPAIMLLTGFVLGGIQWVGGFFI